MIFSSILEKIITFVENFEYERIPRPLYTANINQYLGNKVVKVLTEQRRVGKSYILRQTAMHLMQQGVSGNNIVLWLSRTTAPYTYKPPICL